MFEDPPGNVVQVEEELPIHPDAHFLLYAKGHYKRYSVDGSVWGDLRAIHSHYYGLHPDHITNNDILHAIVRLTEKVVQPIDLITFLNDIGPEECWKIWPEQSDVFGEKLYENYDYYTAIIGKCLSLMRFITVMRDDKPIINLGEIDTNILPGKDS